MSDFFWNSFDDYILLEKKTISDGAGGYITQWTESAIIKALLTLGSAREMREAESQKLQTVYTITLPKGSPVEYNSYIKNVKTDDIYRITSNPQDNVTPPTAKYQSSYATAIKTELPAVIQ